MIDNKKSSILLILKVLEEYSDENHFLTQQEIIDKVEQLYGISLERKSVSFNIGLLQELEYDIVKSPRGGYALLSRLLDASEIQFLIDAIFSSKVITGKQAIGLSKKINSVLSKYQRNSYNYIYKSTELSRSDNIQLFLNIELIEEAKKLGKRISFQYLTFDEEGKPLPRLNGFRYIVSPYYSINNFGKYYLLCNYREKYRALQIFRLDYMIELKIENEWNIKPIECLKGIEKFDISQYLNEHIYMFASDVVHATILIQESWAIQYIDDWFGKNAKIYKKDDQLLVDITCNEDSLFYWMLQYGETFKLLKPDHLIERLKTYFHQQIELYK